MPHPPHTFPKSDFMFGKVGLKWISYSSTDNAFKVTGVLKPPFGLVHLCITNPTCWDKQGVLNISHQRSVRIQQLTWLARLCSVEEGAEPREIWPFMRACALNATKSNWFNWNKANDLRTTTLFFIHLSTFLQVTTYPSLKGHRELRMKVWLHSRQMSRHDNQLEQPINLPGWRIPPRHRKNVQMQHRQHHAKIQPATSSASTLLRFYAFSR